MMSKTEFEEKLNNILKLKKAEEIDLIMKVVCLLFYQNLNNTDMAELFKEIGLDNFLKIINIFGGRTITFPSREKLKDMLISAILYYYREVQNMSWKEIKKNFPYNVETNMIKYGIQIRNLNDFVKKRIMELFGKFKKEELDAG